MLALCSFAWLAACSTSNGTAAPAPATTPEATEPTTPDGETTVDASGAEEEDAGTKPKDGGKDAPTNTPGEILGTLSGACGAVGGQLGSASPSFFQNDLEFVAGETYAKPSLSPGGQKLFDSENAGGSSTESEVMSFEVLHACEGATLLKTETEILYAPPDDAGPSTITDILVEIGGKKVGVSVTRAYKPSNLSFPDSEVRNILEKKLIGINRSSVRVLPADQWVKQILHVFVANQEAADAVGRVLPQIDAATRANTIIVMTKTMGGGFVYCNPDPPLGSECQ